MIVITGAAGFIGSAFVAYLNEKGIMDAVLIDDFSTPMRLRNLSWKYYGSLVQREEMWTWLYANADKIEAIVHLGAKSGFLHDNWEIEQRAFEDNAQAIWKFCTTHDIRLIYASTGAVYGNGTHGFADDADTSFKLQPRHPYTQTKLAFDNWALQQTESPSCWVGMRMFNVYGPNEYHKSQNASMVYKAYNEILSYANLRLFQSHQEDYKDGDMRRDFIYIKDLVQVIFHCLKHPVNSGMYNIGTGEAHTFNQLALKVFEVLGIRPTIIYEPIQEVLREHFPYESKADIRKLHASGYNTPFISLNKGIEDYIQRYLMKGEFY